MTDALVIRNMTRPEVDQLVNWAVQEGWNPGLHDAGRKIYFWLKALVMTLRAWSAPLKCAWSSGRAPQKLPQRQQEKKDEQQQGLLRNR
jgi:hypothetical protein